MWQQWHLLSSAPPRGVGSPMAKAWLRTRHCRTVCTLKPRTLLKSGSKKAVHLWGSHRLRVSEVHCRHITPFLFFSFLSLFYFVFILIFLIIASFFCECPFYLIFFLAHLLLLVFIAFVYILCIITDIHFCYVADQGCTVRHWHSISFRWAMVWRFRCGWPCGSAWSISILRQSWVSQKILWCVRGVEVAVEYGGAARL